MSALGLYLMGRMTAPFFINSWKANLKGNLIIWMFFVLLLSSFAFAFVAGSLSLGNDLLGTLILSFIYTVIVLIIMAIVGLRVSKGKGALP